MFLDDQILLFNFKKKFQFDLSLSAVIVITILSYGISSFDTEFSNEPYLAFAQSNRVNFVTFDDVDSEMIFEYPERWEIKSGSSLSAYFTTKEYLTDLNEVTILLDTHSLDPHKDLFDYVNAQQRHFPNNDFQVIGKTQTGVSGSQAFKIKLTTGKDFDPALTGELVLFEKYNKVYSIGFMTKSDQFSKNNKMAQTMFDSVKVKEKEYKPQKCTYNSNQIQEITQDYQITNPYILGSNEFVIPKWTKNIANWYVEDLISDDDLRNAFSYMIKNNIVQIPEINEPEKIERLRDKLGAIDNIICGWSEGSFSSQIFGITIHHMMKYG